MTAVASTETKSSGGRKLFPLRQRTGTASHHMKREVADLRQNLLEKFTPRETVEFVAEARWGSTEEMPCPHCGTVDTHYPRRRELRWKCKGCGATFSVSSGTVLADHKVALTELLNSAFVWSCPASGVPALTVQKQRGETYPVVYTVLQKLREGLSRGFNVGIFAGIEEFDGMDINGRRHHEKRNKPQGGKSSGVPKIPESLLKDAGQEALSPADKEKAEGGKEFVGPPKPPKYGKAASQPTDRRIMLVMRQRGAAKGKGAAVTRVGMAITESTETVTALAAKFSSAESAVVTDEDNSYGSFAKLFSSHKTIKHSEEFSDRKGTNNNQAESFNKRARRGEKGIYLNISNKYLHEYMCEMAWREDVRKMSSGEKLQHLLRTSLFVGESLYFRGYIQGKHRGHEILVNGELPAKARGRPKGWKAKPPI